MTGSVAIIGGGQAGGTLVQMLRLNGYEGDIVLASAEDVLPYERPPLSKGVLRGDALTPVLPTDFYGGSDVEVRLGFSAVEVQPVDAGLLVTDADGSSITANRVVLATGSRARTLNMPNIELPNVMTLRDAADVTRIRANLVGAKSIVIIGAGFIGTEVAATLSAEGCAITIIEPIPEPLANRLGGWAAKRLLRLHDAAGVEIITAGLERIEGERVVTGVVTDNGRHLPCDLLLVAVGSVPCLEVAERSGLTCDGGVVCDEFGRTSMSGVYAAGDIASWPYGEMGRSRVEHFRSAIDHAQVIAAHLVGDENHRELVPSFWTDQYDHRFEIAGWPTRGTSEVFRYGDDGDPRLSLHVNEGRLVGAVGFDSPREVRAAAHLIGLRQLVNIDSLGDPSIDIRKAMVTS